uniref:Uncharacterized protein n=1 Tax=Moniliophthora roreri TaxID=221103 RepID=A0A0W0F3L6_MONRR
MPQYGPMHQKTFQRLWEFTSQYGSFIEVICWSFLQNSFGHLSEFFVKNLLILLKLET